VRDLSCHTLKERGERTSVSLRLKRKGRKRLLVVVDLNGKEKEEKREGRMENKKKLIEWKVRQIKVEIKYKNKLFEFCEML